MKVNTDLASIPNMVLKLRSMGRAVFVPSCQRIDSVHRPRQYDSSASPNLVPRNMLWATLILMIALIGQITLTTQGFHTPLYAQQTAEGYYYTVQIGDSWGLLSDLTGVSVTELQQLNPSAVRYNQWLRVGEKIFIPGAQPSGSQSASRTHTVKAGESWSIIAAQYDLSSRLLKSVNPASIRDGDILYLGEQLTIPSVIQPSADADANTEQNTTTQQPAPSASQTEIVYEEHQVGGGDSWSIIAAVYGVSISELKNANPNSIRENDVLYFGETLTIPTRVVTESTSPTVSAANEGSTPPSEAATAESTSVDTNNSSDTESSEQSVSEVVATESITSAAESQTGTGIVAEVTPITETDETASSDETSSSSSSPSSAGASTESSDGEADLEEEAETGTGTGEPTTGTEDTSSDSSASISSADLELDENGCPVMFSKYAQMIEMTLADPEGDMTTFRDALDSCSVSKLMETGDWTADGVDDMLIIIQNQESEFKSPEGDILVFNGLATGGFELAYQARSAGKVDLLSNQDINNDGQADIAWIDTTCGASTCFSTVNIRSWVGEEWQDWTEGTLTMAYPDIVLEDVNEDGQASEIVMSGGIYGSTAAGPQRGRTEVWGSVDGAPYTTLTIDYDESLCLYFTVIDGNRAFTEGTPEGFAQAKEYYEQAISNSALSECWERENEGDNLRGFSQFRLALVAAYSGEAEAASTQIEQLKANFPESIYNDLGQVWLDAYQENGDVTAACEAGNTFAEENPEAWKALSDFGYFNPSFSANEVCPILDIEIHEALSQVNTSGSAASNEDESADADPEEDAPESDVAESNSEDTESEASNDDADTAEGEEPDGAVPNETADDGATEEESADDDDASTPISSPASSSPALSIRELAPCPESLDGYADAAATVLTATGGDTGPVEDWMRQCDALNEERGALISYDMNNDGANDFILFPTIVSDEGYGPDGTEGLVLIYHAPDASSQNSEVPTYELTAGPNVFGKPVPIGIADYNIDGKIDLAFTVEGCSSFCVDEVQILSWNGEVYVVTINPGATIAEGTVSFAPVEAADLGQGQSVVLQGGVSGTPEGGLNVPHTEIWQSIEGRPYERIRWTYDRDDQGSNCLGLRLVEADVALQAAVTIGYTEAIDLYTASIDPTLEACSIHGISAAEELILLQGLASFRLIQAHALSGDLGNANTILDAFSRGQPDGTFANIATQWLEKYNTTGNAAEACETIQSLIDENEEIWQITDHYGYNHPSVAAQQICFVP